MGKGQTTAQALQDLRDGIGKLLESVDWRWVAVYMWAATPILVGYGVWMIVDGRWDRGAFLVFLGVLGPPSGWAYWQMGAHDTKEAESED